MSARDKRLIIILVGAVILALSYFLVFQKAQDKKAQLEAQNTELRNRYNELSTLASKVDEYQAEINTMNGEMEKTLVHYPSYLQIENTIMDVVSLEEEAKIAVSMLSTATPLAVDVWTGEVVSEDVQQTEETSDTTDEQSTEADASTDEQTTADESTDVAAPVSGRQLYELYGVENTVAFEATNKGLQSLIELVATADNRQRIDSITVAFNDSTGKLDGTLIYNAFFLYGIDKPYESPFIPSMPHGSKNIFGTVGE